MRGNTFGKLFSFTSFGESHGEAIGVIIDGVPGGLKFSLEDLQKELDRRAPGRIPGTTPRKERDQAEVMSGVFEGQTLGSPISVLIRNTNQRSKDYEKLKEEYRPGHADKTTLLKYGVRDHRGGGRSSGRETIARVIAGYFASLIVPQIKVRAFTSKIGKFEYPYTSGMDISEDWGMYSFPDISKEEEIKKFLIDLRRSGDSIGGKVTIVIRNCPVGLGEPAFDKLKADFAKAFLSIGACVSFSYGLGADMALKTGQEVSKDTSNFGGMEGGISNGDDIKMEVVFKPTSTVGKKALEGRHDPCIIPRAIPVVEAMAKVVLADHYMRQLAYQVNND